MGFRDVPPEEATLGMDYDWKPASGDWDRLRELELALEGGGELPAAELSALIDRTAAGLGFSEAEAQSFAASSQGRVQFVREARRRIRSGSRRLAAALLEVGELSDLGKMDEAIELLESFIRDEVVPFYCEIAKSELDGLRAA